MYGIVVISSTQDGQLRSINTGEPFVFVVKEGDKRYNQGHYEALGEVQFGAHSHTIYTYIYAHSLIAFFVNFVHRLLQSMYIVCLKKEVICRESPLQ